ncbi:CK5P1 [Fasciolopsis buskii]|uniref:CK5P1 n=1 Tax=Fasciolopsis buskii TaxID=27845 RepID=A0A8E0VM52_9TREM|nr:CK5P1 [Fasciolopsis buski]
MAERLKERLLSPNVIASHCGSEDPISAFIKVASRSSPTCRLGADFVCGPDAYRHLPALIRDAHAGQYGASVALSLEETYADVTPVRRCHPVSESTEELPGSSGSLATPFAQISVMRGCDNMCTYCIVPFVRGRERSRPLGSIVDEAKQLVDEGVKEITLLGQNVNSYCDRSTDALLKVQSSEVTLTPGFHTVYHAKRVGLRFADLLDEVSQISPELRVRFTSPHPKDFPSEVLQLIGERANICSQLHLPAQSGSHAVLNRMGRGYTPEAYLSLVQTVRKLIPGMGISFS